MWDRDRKMLTCLVKIEELMPVVESPDFDKTKGFIECSHYLTLLGKVAVDGSD
jgi:hypothetical protein